jgi:hypothetical protein
MTPQQVINETARISGMPREDFTLPTRNAKACEIRHLAIWGIRQLKPCPTQVEIKEIFNFTSRSNTTYAVKKANDLAETCPKFRAMRDQLQAVIEWQGVAA